MLFRRFLATAASKVPAKPTTSFADIVIIGGGPAGLTLAAALKNSKITRDLKCTLIEGGNLIEPLEKFNSEPPTNFMNRVVSLTPTTIDYLTQIGAWNHIKEERIQSYDNISAYDGITNSKIDFEFNNIATMVENFNIQSALLARINELPQGELNILDKTKVVDIVDNEEGKLDWPVVMLDNGDAIQTRLLIGCDGYNSPVRKYAQIESRGWAYNRWGIVGTLKFKDSAFRFPTGWQRFLTSGPIALLPLPDNYTSLVWSTTPELANILMKLPEDKFVAMVNAATKLTPEEMDYLYKLCEKNDDALIDEIQWRLDVFNSKLKTAEDEEKFPLEVESMVENSRGRFPLKLSHSDTYVSDRVALVGDAAHTTHPLAGQGLNMGQLDVQSLMKCLEQGMSRGLDIGNKLVLEPYFSERYPENHVLLGIVDKIHKIYSTDFTPLVMARSFGVDFLNNVPFIKDFMVSQISGGKK